MTREERFQLAHALLRIAREAFPDMPAGLTVVVHDRADSPSFERNPMVAVATTLPARAHIRHVTGTVLYGSLQADYPQMSAEELASKTTELLEDDRKVIRAMHLTSTKKQAGQA